RIAEVMYRVLLRQLGYAEDFSIAELEITLEGREALEAFERRYHELFDEPWSRGRKGADKHNRASRVLHELDPQTYPSSDSWALTPAAQEFDFSVRMLVERTFELAQRRRPGKAVVFIV